MSGGRLSGYRLPAAINSVRAVFPQQQLYSFPRYSRHSRPRADLYPKTLYNQATAYTNERQLYEKFYYPAVYDGTCLFTNCEIGHSLVNTVRRSLYTVTIGQPCNGIVNINLLNLNRNVRTLNSMPRRLSMPVNTTSLGVVTV